MALSRILCVSSCIVAAISAVAAEPRNIVFILTDDQRYDALGIVNPYWRTPHLDALARGGILFENAFVTTSLCSPSRASILSGLYAHAHGVLDNNTEMPSDVPTFATLMQGAGYETAFIGKWHMGGASDAPRPGFNRWVSFRGQGQYYNQTFNIDGQSVAKQGYTTDFITDYAIEFLESEREKPFLLYVSHKAVHAPFSAAERHKGAYADTKYRYPATMVDSEENYRGKPDWVRKQRNSWHGVDGLYNNSTDMDTFVRDYSESLLAVDDGVGRIVETLRAEGLLESTLIVFTSDNGFQFGEHGLIDKRTFYETSIRVPLIVHCPELFAGGQRRKEHILNVDFAPTLLEAADIAIPQGMHGRSFFGLLSGAQSDWREAWLYEYFWERSFPQTPTVLGVYTPQYKFFQYHGIWDRYELYDVLADPQETNNLVGDVVLKTEAGTLDGLLLGKTEEPLRGTIRTLQRQLRELLEAAGAAPEPSWLPR